VVSRPVHLGAIGHEELQQLVNCPAGVCDDDGQVVGSVSDGGCDIHSVGGCNHHVHSRMSKTHPRTHSQVKVEVAHH